MKLKPLFKPLIKQRNKKASKLPPLKEQIEKFDCLPDNAFEEANYENICSSDETSVED
jgi:hypothetical protein